jgi:hypothetical protein
MSNVIAMFLLPHIYHAHAFVAPHAVSCTSDARSPAVLSYFAAEHALLAEFHKLFS